MKVVINSCFGGFNLSAEAILRLYQEKSPIVQTRDPKKYYGNRKGWRKQFKEDQQKGEPFGVTVRDGRILMVENDRKYRADPALVKVVEEMREKANGHCAELKVVEIPNGVEWEIEEYDGAEWVSEKHRRWD